MKNNHVTKAIEIIGLKYLASLCQVSYQAVQKWKKYGLPRTEWTGETNYSGIIEKATGNQVTRKMLLDNQFSGINFSKQGSQEIQIPEPIQELSQ